MSVLDLHRGKWRDDASGCRIWTAALTASGYARVWQDGKQKRVARLVCAEVHGEPGPDDQASHLCHMRSCVSPDHLVWDSPKQNIARNPESRKAGGYARLGTGRGYSRSKGRWAVSVANVYIGAFDTEAEAREAYLEAARRHSLGQLVGRVGRRYTSAAE